MIWRSTPLMTLIDILTLSVVVFTAGYCWYFQKTLRNRIKTARPGVLMTLGLVAIGLLYLSDLIAMWVLPLLVGPESAYAVMEDIHLNYSWILVPFGVFCVSFGWVSGGQIVIDLIENLQNRGGQISQELVYRKKTEEKLRESEHLYHSLVEDSGDFIVRCLPNGIRTFVNEAYCLYYGMKREELLGNSFFPRVVKEDQPKIRDAFKRLTPENPVVYDDHRVILPDGTMAWHRWSSRGIFDKDRHLFAVQGVGRDVTELKRHEAALRASEEQLRLLAARVESAREEERARLAREIHDELGQSITALNFELTWLERKVPREKPLLQRIDSMSRLLERTVGEIKRISAELRPVILDDLGLVAAIEWQVTEFRKRTGIKCRLRKKVGRLVVDEARTTALFRILQEALTNVLRHADATQVDVRLERQNGALVLEVCDNGKGVSEKHLDNQRSFGLLGMRERILPFGGQLLITGKQGEGTILKVQVPLS